MKSTVKSILKVLFTVFLILYLGVEIFITVCLLNFNEQRITELGNKSFIIVDQDLSKDYKKGDLLVVTKNEGKDVEKGDSIFFYNPGEDFVVNFAEVTNVLEANGYYTYVVGNDYNVYYDYFIGKDIKKYAGIGKVLSVLESKYGFLTLIILPTMVAIIFEVYAIILEVVELKKEA
ncbi:MAG: hypothetical protein II625_03995 [Bacilli bacterium]|nr:hypothetical protein [Bacilli bacterium]